MEQALARIAQEVADITGVATSAVAALNGLGDIIRNTEPTAAALNALADSLDAKATELGNAIAANPVPTTEPTP